MFNLGDGHGRNGVHLNLGFHKKLKCDRGNVTNKLVLIVIIKKKDKRTEKETIQAAAA